MATAVLPIREMSTAVQGQAISARRAFWGVVEAEKSPLVFRAVLKWFAKKLDRRMDKLVSTETELVEKLRRVSSVRLEAPDFAKVAEDLNQITSLTSSLIADCYEMPAACVVVWQKNLDRLEDLASYIDNFAESFQVAADETCTALLADIARQVA